MKLPFTSLLVCLSTPTTVILKNICRQNKCISSIGKLQETLAALQALCTGLYVNLFLYRAACRSGVVEIISLPHWVCTRDQTTVGVLML